MSSINITRILRCYKSVSYTCKHSVELVVLLAVERKLRISTSIYSHLLKRELHSSCTMGSSMAATSTLEKLKFDNKVLRSLPIDEEAENYTRQVPGACFSRVTPTPVENPKLVVFSKSALELLNVAEEEANTDKAAEYLSGNKLLPGSETAAHCYCGHQFGAFSGQLGDGCALYLGEVLNAAGERWEVQLKGAGMTPYSRQADGRKVLRSSVREFLCSEAMYHLGIPTTRAGTCITSDTAVMRDIFYNGNTIWEKATVILRIAPTFLRFGSFEIFKPTDEFTGRKGPSVGRNDILVKMLDYVIETFFPEIHKKQKGSQEDKYFQFFRDVVLLTARLVAQWQCVGFCHGVLNTDNMSIVGLTIDYGPFGFMDSYNPAHICNSSDEGGRYAFDKQPEICKWNLEKLAEAIQAALPLSKSNRLLPLFDFEFQQCYHAQMKKKFGLCKELPEDKALFQAFLDNMEATGADFTNSFRALSLLRLPGCAGYDQSKRDLMTQLLSQCLTLEELKKQYAPQMDPRQFAIFQSLLQSNPAMVEMLGVRRGLGTIEREMERMLKRRELEMSNAEKSASDREVWFGWVLKYAARLEKEVADTAQVEALNDQRVALMNGANPRFVLRNYMAQNAIDAAEDGDFSEVQRVLRLLEKPFSSSSSSSGDDDVEEACVLARPNSASPARVKDGDDDSHVSPEAEAAASDKKSSSTHGDRVRYDGKPPSGMKGLRVT
ncbi:PREDICTED: selenoprotein O-like isoform X2 [Priapulus caudatus]|uniref:Selenoprotein O n=1 Tax=Priapulus caudatus TaxID=37621 RepID=A0ABM1EQQ3_PRICU|nr:PREDICTED: selenoprotein O-like isoform X2 [Priapulus caudatus]